MLAPILGVSVKAGALRYLRGGSVPRGFPGFLDLSREVLPLFLYHGTELLCTVVQIHPNAYAVPCLGRLFDS